MEQYGAAGWGQIWTSNETVIHEDTVSPIWGTPDMDTFLFQLKLPVLAISRPEGERLIRKWEKMQKTGSILYADFETKLDTEIKKQTELADHEADLQIGRIGRGADQSFWGAEIPYHINPRYEAAKEHKISDAPGPGVYWWHTIEDTHDKKLKRIKECQASIAEIQLLLKQITERCLELENRWTETLNQLEREFE